MTTSETLGTEYIETEIKKIQDRLHLYNEIYESSEIKCIVLKRLIVSKENELRLLIALE